MKLLYAQKAHHAILYERYSLKENRFIKVGSRQGTYGPENDSGAEYRCLGGEKRGNRISYSSDCKIGLFYSPNVFVWLEDEKGNPVPHSDVLAVLKQIGFSSNLQRAILPKGYNKGEMTWNNAVYFTPVERQPSLDWFAGLIKKVFGPESIIVAKPEFVEAEIV